MRQRLTLAILWMLKADWAHAQNAPLWPESAPEIYSPGDLAGFTVPQLPEEANPEPAKTEEESGTVTLEEADTESSALQIWSSSDAGFIHQGRRRAQPLKAEPTSLPARTRIYTGGRGVLLLGAPERFFAVLLPKTALHSAETAKGWRWTLLDGEAHLRLSARGGAPLIRWKNPDDPIWELIRLKPTPGSELMLHQSAEALSLWQITGTSQLLIPSAYLLPGRPQGQVRELQDQQLTSLKTPKGEARTAINLFPGQALELRRKGQIFELVISLPDPVFWGDRRVLSSPEIDQDGGEVPKESVETLRRRLLAENLRDLPLSEASLLQLMQGGKDEEALYVLRHLPEAEKRRLAARLLALETLLLFRLQQFEAATELMSRVDPKDPALRLLEAAERRAFLRSPRIETLSLKIPGLSEAREPLSSEERYSLALSWLRLGYARYALDAWELPVRDQPSPLLARSAEDWRNETYARKKWALQLSPRYGYASNVTASPDTDEVKELFGRRDSFLAGVHAQLERFVEQTTTQHLALRLDLHGSYFMLPALQELSLLEVNIGLPLGFKELPWSGFSVMAEPFVGRQQRGPDAQVDLYGLQSELNQDFSSGQLGLELAVQLALDPAPGGPSPFDLATGERASEPEADQGFRRTRVALSWLTPERGPWRYRYRGSWEDLDYRASERDEASRTIWGLGADATYSWDVAWSASAHADWQLHQLPAGSQNAGQLQLSAQFRGNLRWTHGLHLRYQRDASAYFGEEQSSSAIELGSSYSW